MLIGEREVHVIVLRMDSVDGETARDRAATRAEGARASTLAVLGRYLGLPAVQVQLAATSHGKPHLATASSLRFNLSHSGDLLVIALALGLEIGVDVERLRPMPRSAGIAKRFFRADEAVSLEHMSASDRDRTFFHCWTQKEAYLKAIGLGMQGDLQSFRVACEPAEPARVEWIAGDDAACWTMHSWEPSAGYTAALAYRDSARCLRVFHSLQHLSPPQQADLATREHSGDCSNTTPSPQVRS